MPARLKARNEPLRKVAILVASIAYRRTPGMFEGGCYCGAIRYRLEAIFDCIYCHCSECKKAMGGPTAVSVIGHRTEFGIIEGTPQRFKRQNGYHHFCSNCGSPLFYMADEGPYVSIAIGSFDTPEQIHPLAHQFWPQRLSWLRLQDELPKFDSNLLSHPDRRRPK